MNVRLVKFAAPPGGPQLVATRAAHMMLRDAWTCACAQKQGMFPHDAGADRSGEGRENSCKPLIRSAQIWYHCNQIRGGGEYSISGFGQSSVTFVAEK